MRGELKTRKPARKIILDQLTDLLPEINRNQMLFHYTSPEGLLSILDSNQLHCSHVFFQNDYHESLNVWRYLFEVLENYDIKKKGFSDLVTDHFGHWKVVAGKSPSLSVFEKIDMMSYLQFTASFSREGDDLGQWRSYCGGGIGFNIKFNINDTFFEQQGTFVENPVSKANCKMLFRDCVYDDETKIKVVEKVLNIAEASYRAKDRYFLSQLFFDLLTVNLFFKHAAFAHERECRIVILPTEIILKKTKVESKVIHFKKGKSYIIPYIKLDIIPGTIKGITQGPGPFPFHSKVSLQMLARKYYGNLGVPIETSTIPYRFW